MKIFPYKNLALSLLFIMIFMSCGTEDNTQSGDEFRKRHSADFPKKINPNYFPYMLGGTIAIVVIGGIIVLLKTNAREKKKREDILSQIRKAYKSGDIFDEDYEELKKGMDPIRYKWLAKAFEIAAGNKRRSDFLHAKYPKEIAKDLFDHKHWIGMTMEQMVDSKGHPGKTEEEILKTKTIKTYIYVTAKGDETYHFVDGILEKANLP